MVAGSVYNMRPGEMDVNALSALVSFVYKSGGGRTLSIVEVGSYAGQSMEIFANTGMVRAIACVDPWRAGWDANDPAADTDMKLVESLFDKRAERCATKAQILKFKGTLQGFAKSRKRAAFGSVDMVYIDALHTFEGCTADITTARASLRPRVAICGHDYMPGIWDGVVKAVVESLGIPDRRFSDGSWCSLVPF